MHAACLSYSGSHTTCRLRRFKVHAHVPKPPKHIRDVRQEQQPLNVVLVGGSRGFGDSLVKKFHIEGHRVFFTSRQGANVHQPPGEPTCTRLIHYKHDISSTDGLDDLHAAIRLHMPLGVDVWINNAAISDSYNSFHEHSIKRIQDILTTNLNGSILSTRLALDVLKKQDRMGHVFNVAGAGSNGMATPSFSIYGCTKAAVSQFVKSVRQELHAMTANEAPINQMGMHTISPGMMPTDLLTQNASPTQLQFFNILCEDPDVVAAYVYDEIRAIVKNKRAQADIRYMTLPRILLHMATFYQRQGRFFK